MNLPKPTTDLNQADEDLKKFGFCIVQDVLNEDQLNLIRDVVLTELEIDEAEGKFAVRDWMGDPDDINRRLWLLPKRHKIFLDLVEHPIALRFAEKLLDEVFFLSNFSANVTQTGNAKMVMHADQMFVPPPWPDFPLAMNVSWVIDDFRANNGGTRVIPRSHLPHPKGMSLFNEDAIPVEAPAGSIVVVDGRLWHQTGENRTNGERRIGLFAFYVKPWIRPQENWARFMTPNLLQDASPRLIDLLGLGRNPQAGCQDRRSA